MYATPGKAPQTTMKMMMNNESEQLLIQGGHIVDPSQGIDEIGDLFIIKGKISRTGREGIRPKRHCTVLNVHGLVVCPGFIDLHCHLRQPGFEEKETIASGTRAAARGGFTTICCMPNTKPPLDNKADIDYLKSVIASEGSIRVLPIGCISRKRKGEDLTDMNEIAAAGVIGFSDDGDPISNSHLMRQALEYSRPLDLLIIDHCEDTTITAGGQINEGVLSAKLGLKGIPSAAEEIMLKRDLDLARQLPGARLHIAHISTEGSVEMLRRAKQSGIMVSSEVTPHHLTLTEEKVLEYDTNAKVKPPLRTKQDVQALITGLREGVIDIIATDHAPHTKADKSTDFTLAAFGISGFETAFGSLMSLVHSNKLSLAELIAKLTSKPARLISDKYVKLGTLESDAPADITILDPTIEWVVDAKTFASKGKNTPLEGSKLKGKVMATISQGKLVYKDNAVKLSNKVTDD